MGRESCERDSVLKKSPFSSSETEKQKQTHQTQPSFRSPRATTRLHMPWPEPLALTPAVVWGRVPGVCRGISASLAPGLQRNYFQREPTLRAAPQRGLTEAAVLGRDRRWPQAWVGGKGKTTLPRCPVGFVLMETFRADKGLQQELRAGESTCVPRAWSAGAGTAGSSLAGLLPLPATRTRGVAGAQLLGRLRSPPAAPRQGGVGGGGGCDTAEASYSAEHPRLPPEPALPGRWQRAGPSRAGPKLGASGGRCCPGPGEELGRARLRAGGRHPRPRRGEVPFSAVKGWKGK